MGAPTVDLFDPSSEGPGLAERLGQEGLEVCRVALADVPRTSADVLLLAGDHDGSLAALKQLRDEGEHGDLPVVLLGLPPGATPRGGGPGFGADAVFARPIRFGALLGCIDDLLEQRRDAPEISGIGLPPPERTMRLPGLDPDSSHVVILRDSDEDEPEPPLVWRPREPTMQLDDLVGDDASVVRDQSAVTRGRADSEVAPSHPSWSGGGEGAPEESRELSRPGSQRLAHHPPDSEIGSRPGTGEARAGDAPQPVIPLDERAQLSPWLERLLASADRRVFPDRAPLALHFPAAAEPAESLIPAELFDSASLRLDEPVVEDPIDAFTFVGGPAVPPQIHAPPPAELTDPRARPTSAEGRARMEQTTATEVPGSDAGEGPVEPEEETPGSGVHLASAYPAMPTPRGADWPSDDTVLGRVTAEGARRGTLGAGGAIRLLWRIASLGLDATCEIETRDGPTLRMTFLAGELRAFAGPVQQVVLDGLRRRGRATEQPVDEQAAEAVLARRVEAGDLGRFERDRLVREAREGLLARLVASGRAEFTLRRLEDTEPGRLLARARVLARPLRAALVSVARDALSVERVAEMLGPAGMHGVGLALGPEREAALAPAELPLEVVELLARLDGHSLADLLAAAPGERGLAGMLYALVAGDALVLREAPPAEASPLAARASVTALVEAAAALAEDGDYFSVLGLAPGADGGAVERAHRARRDELLALPLVPLGLHGLELRRDEALDAIDEARAVLADPRLRRAYARAVDP